MANSLSSFEEMICNNGPVQESIIQNLTRWDFRNLQLAGVRIPVSRDYQREFQKPIRCNEKDPEKRGERCSNSTASVDEIEIRACAGCPVWLSEYGYRVDMWIGTQYCCPCLQHERGRVRVRDDEPDDEPNIDQYPVKSKVCRRCHEFYANKHSASRSLTIAQFKVPLCKGHSLEQNKQSPLNACRCLDYVNDIWRCRSCSKVAMYYLTVRNERYRKRIMNMRIPWYRPFAWLRNYLAPDRLLCPIEGCLQQPWLDESPQERMQMCLGCSSIIRI